MKSRDWLNQIFEKKIPRPEFGPSYCKSGPEWGVFFAMEFGSLVFLEIAYNDILQQCLTSSRGKTHEKFFGVQIWVKQTKVAPKINFFCHFLKFGSLVYREIACNDSLQQCLTSIRGKKIVPKFGPKSSPNFFFFCHFLKFVSLVFLKTA